MFFMSIPFLWHIVRCVLSRVTHFTVLWTKIGRVTYILIYDGFYFFFDLLIRENSVAHAQINCNDARNDLFYQSNVKFPISSWKKKQQIEQTGKAA